MRRIRITAGVIILTMLLSILYPGMVGNVYAADGVYVQDGFGYSGVLDNCTPLGDNVFMYSNNQWPDGLSGVGNGKNAFVGGVMDGQKNIWLVPHDASKIVKVDKDSGNMTTPVSWPSGFTKGDNAFVGGVFDGQNIWLIPYNADRVIKVDTISNTATGYNGWPAGFVKGNQAFAGGVFDGTYIWLVPAAADRVIKIEASTGNMSQWTFPISGYKTSKVFMGGIFDGQRIWLVPGSGTLALIAIDKTSGEATYYPNSSGLGAPQTGGTFDGQDIWLAPNPGTSSNNMIRRVNKDTGTIQAYDNWPGRVSKSYLFTGAVFDGKDIWYTPCRADRVIRMDRNTGICTGYMDWPEGFTLPDYAFWGAVYDGEKIWMVPYKADRLIILDTVKSGAVPDQPLTESNLDGRTISLSLSEDTFKDATLSEANFTLNNAPQGLFVQSVSYTDSMHANVILGYDNENRKDFDSNISDFSVQVSGEELNGGNPLTLPALFISAVNDPESIVLTDDGEIIPGAENGEQITVTLSGGTFADILTPANWTISNLSGVTAGSVTRISNTTAVITLSGNRSPGSSEEAYSTMTVSCTADEYDDSEGGAVLSVIGTRVAAPVIQAFTANTEVIISWDPVPGATGYNLYTSSVDGTISDSIYGGSTGSFTKSGLTNGETYSFILKAVDDRGESVGSNELTGIIPHVLSLEAPAGFTAVSGEGQVTLYWNSVMGATGYKIFWGTSPDSYNVTPVIVTNTVYNMTGLTNGQQYYFKVRAVSYGVEGLDTADMSATPKTLLLGLCWPPMSNAEQLDISEEYLRDLNVKDIRYSVHWRYIEPSQGEYNWSQWDLITEYVVRNNWDVMLTFESDGPGWIREVSPAVSSVSCALTEEQNAYFINFVNDFFDRYPGIYNKVQFGNEWQYPYWYAGSADQYIATNNMFYDAVKAKDPSIQVIIGGIAGGSLRALALYYSEIETIIDNSGTVLDQQDAAEYFASSAGIDFLNRVNSIIANGKFDVMDIHLYDDPENWFIYYKTVKENYPGDYEVIVSEFGGPYLWKTYSEEMHAAEFPQYIAALSQLDIIGAYNCFLVDNPSAGHKYGGLLTLQSMNPITLHKKLVYEVFKEHNDDRTGAAESVTITEDSIKFDDISDIRTLTATVLPEDATNKELEWMSSDTAVATVDADGRVTTKGEGTAIITAKVVGTEVSDTCTVTVEQVTRITIAAPQLVDKHQTFTVTIGLKTLKQILSADLEVSYDKHLVKYKGYREVEGGLLVAGSDDHGQGHESAHFILAGRGAEGAISGTEEVYLIELTFTASKDIAEFNAVNVARAALVDTQGNILLPTLPNEAAQVSIPGDLNFDGVINIADIEIACVYFGKTTESPDWDTAKIADINRDGMVDMRDLAVMCRKIFK